MVASLLSGFLRDSLGPGIADSAVDLPFFLFRSIERLEQVEIHFGLEFQGESTQFLHLRLVEEVAFVQFVQSLQDEIERAIEQEKLAIDGEPPADTIRCCLRSRAIWLEARRCSSSGASRSLS